MTSLHYCGYTATFLSDLIEAEPSSVADELKRKLEALCSFSMESPLQVAAEGGVKLIDRTMAAILQNLVCRGIPTIPSMFIERKMAVLFSPFAEIIEEDDSGSIDFARPSHLKPDQLTLLSHALQPFDSTFRASMHYSKDDFDSEEEYHFYCVVLPSIIGEAAVQFVQPQRSVESMIERGQQGEYYGQAVDFAFEADGVKLIVEIDGEQHGTDLAQAALDKKRRSVLASAGWSVMEISAGDVRAGLTAEQREALTKQFEKAPSIPRADAAYPESSDARSLACAQAVLTPIAVARLQYVVLQLLEQGLLSTTDAGWNIVIIERDVPCAALAIADLRMALSHLAALMSVPTCPPIHLRVFRPVTSTSWLAVPDILPQEGVTGEFIQGEPGDLKEGGISVVIDTAVCRYGSLHAQTSGRHRPEKSNRPHTISLRSSTVRCNARHVRSQEPLAFTVDDQTIPDLRYFLETIFRKKDFRPGQVDILKRSLALKPVIGLLPTGAGKSLTYQLASLLQPGITLIIDPLRSLMFDQVENLKALGIDNIGFINSEQTAGERQQATEEMAAGRHQMMFISPERLQIKAFREKLKEMTTSHSVPYVVIDEAHCVSEWGHDFRTAYLNLAHTASRHCRFQGQIPPTIVALTGTASFAVLTDVQREIGIEDEDAKISPKTFDRPEMRFDIRETPSSDKLALLKGLFPNYLPTKLGTTRDQLLSVHGKSTLSGLVFVPHVNGPYGKQVADQLSQTLSIPVNFYSGEAPKSFEPNLKPADRTKKWNDAKREVQEGFKRNAFPLLVSTKAFGMGIDKPNIRYTIHYGIPNSLEAYYQEAGRSGRDRRQSQCIIIFSDDNGANSDRLLDITKSHREVHEVAPAGRANEGDVHRLMFFHLNAFKGEDDEKRALAEVLANFIYPALSKLELHETAAIVVPFGEDGSRGDREKTLYRLRLVGVVQDYTVDYNGHLFEAVIERQSDEDYADNMKTYVSRYKTTDYANSVPERLKKHRGGTMIEKCLGFLINFVYDEIEKKRRTAIGAMASTVRECMPQPDKDKAFRERILAYLEKSKFTDPLLEMVRDLDDRKWWRILEQADDVDSARQLLGGCLRTLGSYPDHPGLFILSGFARLLLPVQERQRSMEEFETGLVLGKRQLAERTADLERLGSNILVEYRRRFHVVDADLGKLVLANIPSRGAARAALDACPHEALPIFVSGVAEELHVFNNHFIPRESHV